MKPATRPGALIVDTASKHTDDLCALLHSSGFDVEVIESIADMEDAVSLALICMDVEGGDIAKKLADDALQETDEIVLMAAEDDPARVRRGIAAGATYFFCKPFDPDFLKPLLADVHADACIATKRTEPDDSSSLDQFGYLRGSSRPMRKLFRMLRKVASTDATVLLIGESGTGKELAAQTLHQFGTAAEGPFVAMNCGAISPELFESELFGHEKGSFSGADRQHHGFFERANGGTLFLDEITEMPVELQVKLLRVLETGSFRRVGGESDLHSNARIIAATNRQPNEAIADNQLREDLYFRIARFPVLLPPLRSRRGDIAGLAQLFLRELNAASKTSITISKDAIAAIERHTWPGNVRELRSAIERAGILAETRIDVEHLPDFSDFPDEGQLRISVGESIDDAERKLIMATLEANDGDRKATAKALDVSLRTLYNRLREYGGEQNET